MGVSALSSAHIAADCSADVRQAKADAQRVFDVSGIVGYLQSLGAKAATRNFARTLINSGQVPHLRIGRKHYVSKMALDRWIETREKRVR